MGLFDSLLKAGVRAATSKAVDAVFDSIMGECSSGSSKTTFTQSEEDDRAFEEKAKAVFENLGAYEVRECVSPDTLEEEAGKKIYTRGGCYCLPDNFTYVLYKDGQRVRFL